MSCKDKKPDLPLLLITPSELKRTTNAGDEIPFAINLEAEAGIKKFTISQTIDGGSSSILLDTVLSGNLADINFTFKMPTSRSIKEIILLFTLEDALGFTADNNRKLILNQADTLFKETPNLVLYSKNSGKTNAYLIELDSLVFSDSTYFGDIDFQTNDTSEVLQRSWTSPKENLFVKFNSFLYDSASYSSVSQAFALGSPTKSIGSLANGDIIITKLNTYQNTEYAVIKITNIYDEANSDNDRYVFSIKK